MKILEEVVGSYLMGIELVDGGFKLITGDNKSHTFVVEEPYLNDYESFEIDGDLRFLGQEILSVGYDYSESFGTGDCYNDFTHAIEIVFMLGTINIRIVRREPRELIKE